MLVDRRVLDTLRETFSQTGASVPQLQKVTGIPESTLYKVRGRLLKTSWVGFAEAGHLVLAALAPDEKSPWDHGVGDD